MQDSPGGAWRRRRSSVGSGAGSFHAGRSPVLADVVRALIPPLVGINALYFLVPTSLPPASGLLRGGREGCGPCVDPKRSICKWLPRAA